MPINCYKVLYITGHWVLLAAVMYVLAHHKCGQIYNTHRFWALDVYRMNESNDVCQGWQ